MQVAIVIGLVALILVAAAATVAAQDRRAQRQEVKRRQARLARLGEPTPHFASHPNPHHRRWPEG